MNLSFAADDIFDSVVFESSSGSPLYQLQTPKHSGRVATTASRYDYVDSSSLPVFQIRWAGNSLEHRKLVLDFATNAEYGARDVLRGARGGST